MDYKLIKPIEVEGYADADGIYENQDGAWLGDYGGSKWCMWCMPYIDEDGDYIPAPENWKELVVANA